MEKEHVGVPSCSEISTPPVPVSADQACLGLVTGADMRENEIRSGVWGGALSCR